MTFNLEILRKRFAEIETNLLQIEEASQMPQSEFLGSSEKADATMFRLLICIEAAQTICTHVAPRVSAATPDSMAECFECLSLAGVYSPEFAARLSAMARFRNLLVQRYWGLDLATVHGFLGQSAADLRQYIAAVAAAVKE
jgi:uncharacterized protein YutE (UPF0331/DUF86 family)